MIDCTGRTMADTFATLRSLVQVCQRRPPSARNLLLQDDDPAVEQELVRRVSLGHITGDVSRSWITEHQHLYSQLRLSWGAPPPHQRTAQSSWLSTLTPLHRSTLILHQHRLVSSSLSATASGQHAQVANLMVDLNPSASRLSASTVDEHGGEISPCILPQQTLWLHIGNERLLLGREALLLQGYPIHRMARTMADLPERFLQDLAGNAVSLPVSLALVMASIHAISWKEEPGTDGRFDTPSSEEVDAALALLDLPAMPP